MSTAPASHLKPSSTEPLHRHELTPWRDSIRARRSLLAVIIMLSGSQLGACGGSAEGSAEAVKHGLHVQNAYIKRAVPGRSMTAAYATLINYTNDELCFVGFESNLAAAIELHVTEPVGGPNSQRVAMRRIHEQCIAPNTRVVLQPGGKHLMVIGLTTQHLPESVTIRLGTSSGRLFATEFATVPFNYSPENL